MLHRIIYTRRFRVIYLALYVTGRKNTMQVYNSHKIEHVYSYLDKYIYINSAFFIFVLYKAVGIFIVKV